MYPRKLYTYALNLMNNWALETSSLYKLCQIAQRNGMDSKLCKEFPITTLKNPLL